MKAIIMSHENGGSYCIDSTGSFHFVEGHQDKEIGAEITIQAAKKPARFRRLYLACAVVFVALVAISIVCSLAARSQDLANSVCRRLETVCQRQCAYTGPEGCMGNVKCDFLCMGN